ncbi:hypothetical protein N7492_004292 [Penicillium capsulatum]|uniref:Uncharacterized protein n=1 Tax=Penicillium capsulatum TaxID=69766 RepID=A0A9W9LPW7_9EURO|nr:hypothetical protein N7492_004292 [Penicillium capsulatum]KAJ6136589.1 hypothetical protein N7512_001749 [Penicillium capsulatum]
MPATTATASSTTFAAADYTPGPDFQGWYLGPTVKPFVCPNSEIFTSSSRYAYCSKKSRSEAVPTTCSGSVLVKAGGSNYTCTSTFSCDSFKIYPTENAKNAWTKYACVARWGADSIYRTLPTRFTSSSAAPAAPDITSDSASPTTGSLIAPTDASTESANSDASGSSISGGAIAGIVVGCVAAVAIVAIAFLLRKKIMACFGSKKPPVEDGPASAPFYTPPQIQPMDQVKSNAQPSEMPADPNAIHEIGSSQATETNPKVVHEIG